MTITARRSIPFVVAALWLTTSACVVTSVSPREAFLRANSSERKKYVSLWEISPEALRESEKERYHLSAILVTSLLRDYSKYDDLRERLENLGARLKKSSGSETEILEKLLKQAAFDSKKDTLFFYDYHHDWRHREFGWMVVRDNRIRVKQALGSSEWLPPK